MRTRRSRVNNESKNEEEEEVMDWSSSDDTDDIFQDENDEHTHSNHMIETPSTFFEIPIIRLNNHYYMTAIYAKKFLHLSDYDLVKVFKKFGEESVRMVLYQSEMNKLVKLSQHQYLCHDLEIKPNIKGIVLFGLEWLVKMFNTELLISDVPNYQELSVNNFSVVFDMDSNFVEFKEDISIELEEKSLNQSDDSSVEDEETIHTCAIRMQGIEKFQQFLHNNLTSDKANSIQRRIIAPLDY